MVRAVMTVAMLMLAAVAQGQTFQLGQPLTAAWDPPTNEADSGIDAYQWKLDGDTVYVAAGVTIPRATYSIPLPQARLTAGNHTIYVRACRQTTCSPDLVATFAIERPVPGTPRAPGGGVVRPTTPVATISVPKAIDLANAYALWNLPDFDRKLTNDELNWLGVRHGSRGWTKPELLVTLDEAWVELVTR